MMVLCVFYGPYFKVYRKFVGGCLTSSHTAGMTSIAFPAIGTGRLGVPHAAAAKWMFDEAIDFSESNPGSSLKEISFVLYDGDKDSLKVHYFARMSYDILLNICAHIYIKN